MHANRGGTGVILFSELLIIYDCIYLLLEDRMNIRIIFLVIGILLCYWANP